MPIARLRAVVDMMAPRTNNSISLKDIAAPAIKPRYGDTAGRARASQGSRPVLPLVSHRKASPFSTMVLLVSAPNSRHTELNSARLLGRYDIKFSAWEIAHGREMLSWTH